MRKFYKKYKLQILVALIILIAGAIGLVVLKSSRHQSAGAAAVILVSPSPSSGSYEKVKKYQVPILMYHYIRIAPPNDTLGANLSVSPDNFDAQLKYLKDEDYQSIKVADIADPSKKTISKIMGENKKPVAITFDDGYDDAYTAAFPILKKYDFNATFYIIRDYVGRPDYMTQSQIDALASAGMEIGSHTLSHPDLSKISAADQRKQIFDSKENAETFCYPSGKFNDTTIALVKEAGYVAAVTTKIGIARETSDLLKLPRVRIENVGAQAFADKISYAYEHGSN